MAEHGEEDVDTPDANEEIGMARQEYQTDVQNYQFVKENSPYPKSIDSSVYMARQRMFSSAANLFAVKAHYTRLDGSDSLAVSPGSPSPSESEYYSAESGSNSLANLSSGEGPTADVFSLPATQPRSTPNINRTPATDIPGSETTAVNHLSSIASSQVSDVFPFPAGQPRITVHHDALVSPSRTPEIFSSPITRPAQLSALSSSPLGSSSLFLPKEEFYSVIVGRRTGVYDFW